MPLKAHAPTGVQGRDLAAFAVAAVAMFVHTFFSVEWLWAPPVIGWSSNAGALIIIERLALSVLAGLCVVWLRRSTRHGGGARAWLRQRAVGLGAFVLLACAGGAVLAIFSPGVVDEDFFYVLHMARSGAFSDWYSYIHPILAQLIAMVLPFPSAFALANVLGLSAILAATIALSVRRGAPAWVAVTVVSLVAISIATWFTAMQPTRDSWFTLLFIGWLLVGWRQVVDGERLSARVIGLHVSAATVLAVYRLDVLPAAALLIGVLAMGSGPGRLRRVGLAWAGFALALALAMTLLPRALSWLDPAVHSRGDQYPITLVLNPLGHLLQQGYRPHVPGKDERVLGRVIDVDAAREVSLARNIPVFYQGHWYPKSTPEQRRAFRDRALRLFAENPGLFLESRWRTFAIAAGLQEGRTATYYPREVSRAKFPWAMPATSWFPAAERRLLGVVDASLEFDGVALRGKFLHWNLIPALIACLAILLLWTFVPATATVAAAVLLRTAVVFIAAPASFFQYHWALHLVPFLLVPLAVAEWRTGSGSIAAWLNPERATSPPGTEWAPSATDKGREVE
jgi:hypothetical protein